MGQRRRRRRRERPARSHGDRVTDAESLYTTLRDGTPEGRRALLGAFPDSGGGVPVASLLESGEPGMVILAFVPVVVRLCAGVDPATGTLAPLVDWVGGFVANGVIAPGDHVAYAPDEDLGNVPLGYLTVRGKPLIDLVSLSRIHSAFHLAHVLAGDGGRPGRFLAFVVPTRQNTERASWPKLQRYLREPVAWLEQHLGGELPDEDALACGDVEWVLTPSKVLDLGLDLTGSHVSLMTCVSGLSREGLGGDALGIEWAFTQAGAASLLASHWDVNAQIAAAFLRRFYEYWLAEGATRAQAVGRTVAEFRARRDAFGRPEAWAAFSLTGDWR